MYCADQMLPTISSASFGETLSAACKVSTGRGERLLLVAGNLNQEQVLQETSRCYHYLEKH